jgi:hypothetical protein
MGVEVANDIDMMLYMASIRHMLLKLSDTLKNLTFCPSRVLPICWIYSLTSLPQGNLDVDQNRNHFTSHQEKLFATTI